MRTNIPAFRLPAKVLNEEMDAIIDMGVDLRLNTPVESMSWLLDQGFDAVFIGSGAPRGKELDIPGRQEADANTHIGIDWLESVAFGHTEKIGKTVLIIGAGNTAMDCCRTSKRLGATDIKVMARKPKDQLKASDWELEDALGEGIELVTHHSPKEFVLENGKLKGMTFETVEYYDEGGRQKSKVTGEVFLPADDVILAIGQENAFPWIERDIGLEFDEWEVPVVDKTTFESTLKGVFFGGDAAFGPENIIWAVEHGHQAAISIHKHCHDEDVAERPPRGVKLEPTKMGIHEWSYSNDYDPNARKLVPHVSLKDRFKKLDIEVELGFGPEEWSVEVERCLNCDIQTVFEAPKCIECDACIDICPTSCLTITKNGDEDDLRSRLKAPAENKNQPLYVSEALKQTGRVMVKDEDQCVHCGLCAERCPTAAWDMQRSSIHLPYAADTAVGDGRGSGAMRREQTQSYRPWGGFLRVQLVFLQRVGDRLRGHGAVVGQCLQRGHRDPVPVHLEEVPQLLARVAATEAVGAEYVVRARHPGPDLVGERTHVITGGDHRAIGVVQ